MRVGNVRNKMDVINNSTFSTVAEVLSQTIEVIIELVFSAKDVIIEKESFADLASYLEKIVPLLKELHRSNISESEGLSRFLDILNREVKTARQLTLECSKRNKVYLLVNCRSYAKRIEDTTREISRALSLIPFGSLEVSSSIVEDINKLCDNMRSAEFKAAIAEEEILEKIESGIQERNVDRSYANKLLVSIADALGISSERCAWKKEFEEFKSEIENAQLRKDRAEAIQLEQIIALLEMADATSSLEEKEIKYLSKRNSLGSQPLEPLSSFYCPITKDVMVDPVETSSGYTFERSAIEKWLAEGHDACPISRISLEIPGLRPNKTLRQSIEEWKDRNTMITIASIKPKLLSDKKEEVLCFLEQLQGLCEQRDLHREWIVLENYIPVLIKLLDEKNRDIRNHALVILCILAKDSDDVKERIAKIDNAIESIVRSLGRRIGEGKLAVALLLELSKSESVRDCIGKVKGCIFFLVTISSGDDIQAARDARELLDNLSFSDLNVIQMAESNYFKHLLQRLESGPEDSKMIMATTLAEMEMTDHNKSSLVEEGVLDSLLPLVSEGNVQLKEVAAKALQSLSSLPKNGLQMIRRGCVRPLLDVLYRVTLSSTLREHVAVTIMHLAISTASPSSSKTQVLMLESDEDINRLFSYTSLPAPLVQQSILRAFHALCQSPSAATVKEKLAQGSAVQVLVQLCEVDNLSLRSSAINLFSCLIEDVDETTIMEHVGQSQKSIETLVKIIKTSNDEEEIASAMGIICNLPELPHITEWLLEAGGLSVIFSHLHDCNHNGQRRNQIIENAVGALCRFTVPTNQQSQKKAAEAGVIPILVRLLELGTTSTKWRAAICLAQFSKSSIALCRPIPKHRGLFGCFAATPEAGCVVHQGYCTVESSFCLVEAGAVVPLVGLLGEQDPKACEASLDALLTLIEGERLQNGVKVLTETKAIPPIIKLLNIPSMRLQEKVLNSLERIFRLVEIKQKYGASAQMPLVDLTQRGNSNIKSLAAKILAQLNVLHEQSSYF